MRKKEFFHFKEQNKKIEKENYAYILSNPKYLESFLDLVKVTKLNNRQLK